MVSDFKWYGSDPSAYQASYEFRTEESPNPWTDLIAVIASLNNPADTGTALPPDENMNTLYRAISTDILFANLDPYGGQEVPILGDCGPARGGFIRGCFLPLPS